MAKSPYDPALLAKLPKAYLEEDIGPRLVGFAVAFIVLQTALVPLFYTSRWLTKTLHGVECWLFMPIGYLANISVCICSILAVQIGGAGHHIEAVLLTHGQKEGMHMAMTRAQLDKPVEYCNHAATTATRLVILALYMRIFSTNKYRYAAYAVGGLIILTWIASIILSSSICTPLAYQWDKSIPGGKCGSVRAYYTWISVPSILCDVIMLVLPLPALYKLRMGVAAKIGLIATFLIGSVGIITACLRMARFITTAEFGKDSTYNSVVLYQLVIAEGGTYLIASCMSTLRPLKRRMLPEYSFTNLVDSTLKKLSINGSDSNVFGTNTAKRWGLVRTVDSEGSNEVEGKRSGESDLEAGNVEEMRVVPK